MNKGAAAISIVIAAILGFVVGNITSTYGNDPKDKDKSANVQEDKGGTRGIAAPGAATGGNEGAPSGGPMGDSDKIPVGKSPALGPSDALATMVIFSDFQCPFCGRVEPTIRQLRQKYGNDLRIVWKNYPLPFHDKAMPAAEAAMAAGAQGKFWEMHDILFENNTKLERSDLESYAQQLQLDMNKFRQDMDSHTFKADIDADMKLADAIGARGTPHFFINGTRVVGAKPLEAFTGVIDQVIAKAKTLPRDQVYAMMVKDPVASPEPPEPKPEQRAEPDPNVIMKVPVGDSPALGKPDALVTAVVFSDFECPFCARVEPTLKAMRDKYGDDLRIVWKHEPLPFHQKAGPAATASIEIMKQKGNDAFWQFHDTLFTQQQAFMTAMQDRQKQMQDNPQAPQAPMPPSPLERANLETIAQQLGCDMTAFKAALDTNAHAARIKQDQDLASQIGASGTPHFFINGKRLVGAQPAQAFEAAIDEARTRANALVSSGVPRANVYDKMMETASANVVMLNAGAGNGNQPAQPPAPPPVRNVPPNPNAPFRGGKDAKVVIEHFSDFQCPFCGMVNPALDQIVKTYGDKVKVVWRDFPLDFHQNAMPAAEAAREVFKQQGNDGFWKFHDTLMANQSALSRADLERYAQQQGVDMTAFRAALDSHVHQAAVRADAQAGQGIGVNGTPATFVNGHSLEGAVPFDEFKKLIDAELAH